MGMVALRSSISGTSVISRIGPTISGMNLILCGPAGQDEQKHEGEFIKTFHKLSKSVPSTYSVFIPKEGLHFKWA